MKKKLILLLIFLPLVINAQISDKANQTSPSTVINEIKEISKHVHLSEQKQMQLEGFLLRTLNESPKASGTLNSLDIIVNSPEFQSILGSLLHADFITNYIPLKATPYQWVLHYRKELKLSNDMINHFIKKSQESQLTGAKPDKEVIAYQNKILSDTLVDWQLRLYSNLKGHFQSREMVKNTLTRLRKKESIAFFDTSLVSSVLLAYQVKKNSTLNYLILTGQSEQKIRQADAKMLLEKPFLLYKTEAYTSSLPNSSLKDVLEFRNELGLSKSKIDSLIFCAANLDKLKTDHYLKGIKFNGGSYQDSCIIELLSEDQLKKFLFSQNKEKVISQTEKEWNELIKFGLVKEVDKELVLKDLKNFNTNLFAARELYRLKKNRRNAYLLTEFLDNRPNLLIRLTEAKNM